MASSIFAVVLIILSLMLLQPASCLLSDSSSCLSIEGYTKCLHLSELNSTLHYTYNKANSTFSLKFVAAPPTPTGWVAWGINPTGEGMIGAQVIAAFKEKKIMVTKTFDLRSHTVVVPSKLSFDIWDVKAEEGEGEFMIYATIKLPKNIDAINITWQIGYNVTKDGMIVKHSQNTENFNAKGRLNLTSECAARDKAKSFHEAMSIMAWGILNPIGLIAQRHVNDYPSLFHVHVCCHLLASFIGVGGGIIGMLKGFSLETQYNTHGIMGIILMLLVFIQAGGFYLKQNEHNYRDGSFLKIYHYISGYIVTIFGLVNIFLGYAMDPEAKWKSIYSVVLSLLILIGFGWELL